MVAQQKLSEDAALAGVLPLEWLFHEQCSNRSSLSPAAKILEVFKKYLVLIFYYNVRGFFLKLGNTFKKKGGTD